MIPAKQAPFNYSLVIPPVLAGESSDILRIVTDSDSIFENISRQACLSSPTIPQEYNILAGSQIQTIYCTIYDTQIGRYLTNGKTPVVNIFGTAQFPNVLPKSHWLGRRAVLEIVIYNETQIDLAESNLVFSGIKHMVQGE